MNTIVNVSVKAIMVVSSLLLLNSAIADDNTDSDNSSLKESQYRNLHIEITQNAACVAQNSQDNVIIFSLHCKASCQNKPSKWASVSTGAIASSGVSEADAPTGVRMQKLTKISDGAWNPKVLSQTWDPDCTSSGEITGGKGICFYMVGITHGTPATDSLKGDVTPYVRILDPKVYLENFNVNFTQSEKCKWD